MVTENRKIQIPVTVDATGAKGGFQVVKDGARDMAAGVSQAAQSAGQAVDGIGDGAGPASQKMDRATSAIVASVQRATAALEAGGRSTAKYYEAIGQQRGANLEVLRPYLAQLEEVERRTRIAQGGLSATTTSLDGMGMSAKATAAALRGVPAQLTDIVVSLQGGQRPLTVLLQQGGQLKDMFGGIGNAARALGGYVVGLINPFTLAAGAVALLAYAFLQGGKESEAYSRALVLTGNAAGATTTQLADMARALGSGNYTQSQAASAIAAIAESGAVGSAQLQKFAAVAIDVERAAGQAVSKTVDIFKELERAPVEASVKLNNQIHFLTLALYEQIKVLDDQGRATDAARVAQNAYADVMAQRSKQIVENNGFLETSWRGVALFASKAWDAMLGIGRPAAGSQQLAALRQQLEIREARGPLNAQSEAAYNKGNEALRQQIALLERLNGMQAQAAEKDKEQARLVELKTKFDKDSEGYLTKQLRLKTELAKAEGQYKELLDKRVITERQYATLIAGIREKYKESGAAGTGEGEVAAIRARTIAAEQQLQQLRAQGAEAIKLTEGEKLAIKIQQELQSSIKGTARAQKELALQEAQRLAVVERATVVEELRIKGLKEAQATLLKQIDAVRKSGDGIKQQALDAEAANAVYGKGKVAVEQQRLALLQLQATQADSSDSFDPAYVAALAQKVAWQQRYVKALQDTEAKQLSARAAEQTRVNAEEARTIELEFQLLGATVEVRDQILARRQVEIKLAKELIAIEQSGATDEAKAAAQASARANAAVEASNAANRAILQGVRRTGDQITSSLTDAILRGFESGKSVAENFRDTVVNMFKTLVLRPVISAIINPVGQAVGGVVNGALSSITGGSSVLGAGNQISTLSSLVGGGTGVAGLVGSGVSSIFGAAAGNAAIGTSLGLGAASSTAAASAAAVAGGTSAAGAGIGAALGTLAAAVPYIAAIVAIASLFEGDRGGPKVESGFTSGNIYLGDAGRNNPGQAKTIVDGLDASFAAYAKQFGLTSRFTSGAVIGQDPEGTSATQLQVASSVNGNLAYNRAARLGGIENVGRSDAELQSALGEEAVRALYGGLVNSDLAEKFKGYLNKVVADDSTASDLQKRLDVISQVRQFEEAMLRLPFDSLRDQSVEAAQSLFDLAGGMEQLAGNLQTYYQNFYSIEEQRNQTAQNIQRQLQAAGVTVSVDDILSASRQKFRTAVDLASQRVDDEGKKIYTALLSVSGAFATITNAAIATTSAVDSTFSVFERVTARERQLAESRRQQADAARQVAQEQVSGLTSLFDLLRTNVAELQGQVQGTQAANAAASRLFIEQALGTARSTGYLPQQDALSRAISGARAGLDAGNFTTRADKDFATLRLASDLQALQGLTGTQLTVAEQQAQAATQAVSIAEQQVQQLDDQLSGLREQIDLMRSGLDVSIGIREAVNQLTAAILVEKGGSVAPAVAATPAIGAAFGQAAGAIARADVGTASFGAQTGAPAVGGPAGNVLSSLGIPFDFNAFISSHLADPGSIAAVAQFNGLTQADIARLRGIDQADVQTWFTLQGIPRFAGGGDHAGGLRLVGERGPELEYTPPARIYNATDTSAMLGGSRAMLEELQGIRGAMDKMADVVVRMKDDIADLRGQFSSVNNGGALRVET